MTLDDAITQACAEVGIVPPRSRPAYGKWIKTDTLSGRNGHGDGRLIIDELRVTAHNWQIGVHATVFLKDKASPVDRRQMAERQAKDDRAKREKAARAAHVALEMVDRAQHSTHPYSARKGFPTETALVMPAVEVRAIGGEYLVAGDRAIIMPARRGSSLTSVQLIWEDGGKKFLAGGETGGSSYRIARGNETWLCEGYATGLSLRTALKSLNRSATILCCFSASNVAHVARSIDGKCFIAADHDKPLEQFGWTGTGEHYAKIAGKPFTMPPDERTDFNDMHLAHGIFALQKHLMSFLRGSRV